MYIKRHTLMVLAVPALMLLASTVEAGTGKVVFATEEVKDQAYQACKAKYGSMKSSATLMRNQDKNWEAWIVAFFPRKAVLGPITWWVFDKSDKAALKHWDPVAVKSVDWDMKSLGQKHFVYQMLFDANFGFNANRTYVVYVGQLINGKKRIYAKGEVLLQKPGQ